MKVIVTGGGTGGHILPALSVIESLRDLAGPDLKIKFIGSYKPADKKIVEGYDITYGSVLSGKFRRYWLTSPIDFLRNIRDLFLFGIGIIQAFFILLFYRPQVIFSKGGYVSLPVVISGFTLRIPILAHESDAALGLANRIALPFVTKIAVGFETENYPKIPINKIIYTGNPIRKKITNAKNYSKVECRKLLKIKLDHPLILIIGGSQGAASLNKIIFEDLPKILSKYYLIHLTGVGDYEKALSLQKKIKNKGWYHPFDFVTEELGYMLKAADLVISRAGANTITELAYLERPTILVPLMGAAGEHQMKNAQALSSQAATFIFDQKKEGPERLIEKIQEILNDEKLQKKLAQNIYRFADEQASTRIAEQVLKIAKK